MNSVKITSDFTKPRHQRQSLYIDGEQIKGIATLTLNMEPNDLPTVEVTMAIGELETDLSEAKVHLVIPKSVREGLIQLGWTPPAN